MGKHPLTRHPDAERWLDRLEANPGGITAVSLVNEVGHDWATTLVRALYDANVISCLGPGDVPRLRGDLVGQRWTLRPPSLRSKDVKLIVASHRDGCSVRGIANAIGMRRSVVADVLRHAQ